MSVTYTATLMYGYKLNPEEAEAVSNYLQTTSGYTAEVFDEYFHPLSLYSNKGAIFGIKIVNVEEESAVLVNELVTYRPEATNMSWAWDFNTHCDKFAPNAKKGMYICHFVG